MLPVIAVCLALLAQVVVSTATSLCCESGSILRLKSGQYECRRPMLPDTMNVVPYQLAVPRAKVDFDNGPFLNNVCRGLLFDDITGTVTYTIVTIKEDTSEDINLPITEHESKRFAIKKCCHDYQAVFYLPKTGITCLNIQAKNMTDYKSYFKGGHRPIDDIFDETDGGFLKTGTQTIIKDLFILGDDMLERQGMSPIFIDMLLNEVENLDWCMGWRYDGPEYVLVQSERSILRLRELQQLVNNSICMDRN